MRVKDLKSQLAHLDDDAEVLLADYYDGKTRLWYLNLCCNTERQAEFGQVWFSRQILATDCMDKNDALFAKEQAARA